MFIMNVTQKPWLHLSVVMIPSQLCGSQSYSPSLTEEQDDQQIIEISKEYKEPWLDEENLAHGIGFNRCP